MAWTAFHYKKPGTIIWGESNETKIISDTWDTQIYCQKARESRRQGESRSPRDLQEWSRNSSVSDKAQQTSPVRELSKTMDAPAPVHLKEMYKVIRHVLSTKGYGLKLELRKDMIKWALKALSDSDFASDKETRISVFGYIIYFCGIPIAWRSKGMKSVVLSTTEAEYMALSEVV